MVEEPGLREHWEEGLLAAERHGVHLLENSVLPLWGVRLLGCTLWTDYELFGPHMRDAAMHAAAHTMLDHRRIKWRRDPWQRFRPAEARLLHHRSRSFLETELAKSHDGPTVCISHHAMTPEAVAPAFRNSIVTAAYASEMSSLIDRFQPDLIVSGHTHHAMDLTRGRTRLLSNPAGYPGESRSFDPAFVVDCLILSRPVCRCKPTPKAKKSMTTFSLFQIMHQLSAFGRQACEGPASKSLVFGACREAVESALVASDHVAISAPQGGQP